MNLWLASSGTTVRVPVQSYTQDFQVMLQQLWEELQTPEPETVTVRVREYDDFRKWVADMPPDYDRYTYDCVDLLVRLGKLPKEALSDYDASKLWKGIREIVGKAGETCLYELGHSEYINKLAGSIICGENVPPVITSAYHSCRCGEDHHGGPVDGRHRTLAAIRLGLKSVPVIELEHGD